MNPTDGSGSNARPIWAQRAYYVLARNSYVLAVRSNTVQRSTYDLTVVVEIVPKSTYLTNGEVGGSPAGAGNFQPPEDKSIRIRRLRMFRRRI